VSQAISRGVVTPSGTKYIILFVTKQKQEAPTQYNDYLDGDLLHWEGEEKHSSDTRVIHAKSANDEIHLFY
jgi:putative restriction endonuclease